MIEQPYSSTATAEQGGFMRFYSITNGSLNCRSVSVQIFTMLAHRELYSLILSTYSKNGVALM